MKLLLPVILLFALQSLFGQNSSVGIFDNHTDIGKPKTSGAAVYDPATQSYQLTGAGYNIWFERDELQYAYKKIAGDFILTANFAFIGKGTDPHRKIGWMVRESLADNAAHMSAVAHGDGLTVLQWRVTNTNMIGNNGAAKPKTDGDPDLRVTRSETEAREGKGM